MISAVDPSSTTNQYQIYMVAPNATTPSKIQTIQQNIGYNQNLLIQESGGNVGVGLTTTQA